MFQHCLHSTGLDRAHPRASKLHHSSYESNAVGCRSATSTRTLATCCIIKKLQCELVLLIQSKSQPFTLSKVSTHCFNMEPDTAPARTTNKQHMLATPVFLMHTPSSCQRKIISPALPAHARTKKKEAKCSHTSSFVQRGQ